MLVKHCKLCNSEDMNSLNIANYLFNKDTICDVCRSKLEFKEQNIIIENINILGIYLYNEQMKDLLLQYKESCDESLYDVFMYKYRKKFKRKYKGYKIVVMPSSTKKQNLRGFNHLSKIFEGCGLEIVDILEKVNDVSQKDLGYEKRLEMKNNIKIKEHMKVPEKVLLVDDVVTTGSSIIGAIRVLDTQCKEIKVFCLSYNKSWII